MTALIPILSLLKNPWVLLILACAIGIGGTGWYRMKWQSGEVKIAQKDAAIAGMKAQQAANIAAAEKAVRERLQADIAKGNAVAADLRKDLASQQEKLNAAE